MAEKPTFVHPDIPFDPELGKHCAFPSLPANHPGPGPSEIWAAQKRVDGQKKNPEHSHRKFQLEVKDGHSVLPRPDTKNKAEGLVHKEHEKTSGIPAPQSGGRTVLPQPDAKNEPMELIYEEHQGIDDTSTSQK